MPESARHTYEELHVGDSAEFSVEVTPQMIDAFGQLSGDLNPLHMDQAYAARTEFGGRVGHGMFAGLWFSRLVGMHLPGRYALYMSQELRFHHPLLPGKTFLVRGEIVQKTDAFNAITLANTVTEQGSGSLCAEGRALVKVLNEV